MDKLTMFVVTHKELDTIIPERTVIGVGGKELKSANYFDNTGENISTKNSQYCELTALYWIWKNYTTDYVGIEHYRRQFIENNELITKDSLQHKLEDFDVIVSKEINESSNVYHGYVCENSEEELLQIRDIIKNKYPNYLASFDYMKKTNRFCVCNMIVTKKEIFDNYCEWLFDILFTLEDRIDISNRTPKQKRMYGFLAERLLNVYLWKHRELKICNVKISEPPIKWPTQKFLISREIKYYIKKLINYENFYR